MENTLKNKVKFFAQYYGQQILCFKGETSSHKYMIVSDNGKTLGLPQQYLELTPLHLIGDEDAIELSKYMTYRNNDSKYNRESYFKIYSETLDNEWIQYIKSFCVNTVHFDEFNNSGWDYLRSKGYALPYNGLSVEEQVSRGWVVLKTKI